MRHKRYIPPVLVIVLLMLVAYGHMAVVVHVSSGPVMKLAALVHLVLGATLLGVLKGLLLSWKSRTPIWRAVPTLTLASNVSGWTVAYLLHARLLSPGNVTIENLTAWFWTFVFIVFLTTLVIELPFFAFALWNVKRSFRRTAITAIVVHAIAFVLLLTWYWSMSGTGMLARLDVVSPEEMDVPQGHDLYYISTDGESIIRADLVGKTQERIVAPQSDSMRWNTRLFARGSKRGGFDLHIRHGGSRSSNRAVECVREGFSPHAPIDRGIAKGYSARPEGTAFNVGPVPRLARESDWKYYVGVWAVQGIHGRNEKTNESFWFSLDTPFVAWLVRNATHIDGDFVVFQLGRDQICVLQPQTRQIALIARGRGPIVAKDPGGE